MVCMIIKYQVDGVIKILTKKDIIAIVTANSNPFANEFLSEYLPKGFETMILSISATVLMICTTKTEISKSFVLKIPINPMEKYFVHSHNTDIIIRFVKFLFLSVAFKTSFRGTLLQFVTSSSSFFIIIRHTKLQILMISIVIAINKNPPLRLPILSNLSMINPIEVVKRIPDIRDTISLVAEKEARLVGSTYEFAHLKQMDKIK